MTNATLPTDPNHFNDVKTAYFAGLIDGEGHVTMAKAKRENGNGYRVSPKISVGMTCETTIRALHEYFVVGHFFTQDWHLRRNPNHKRIWVWGCSARQAQQVAKIIRPYSITKGTELDVIINWVLPKRGSPVTLEHNWSKHLDIETSKKIKELYLIEYDSRRSLGKKRISRGWVKKTADVYGVSREVILSLIYSTIYCPKEKGRYSAALPEV